ncbi:MAG TPA: VOC family protein, partial [Flavobacterium sp.]|nr:VOC family protein [Flavobacterium sp.]
QWSPFPEDTDYFDPAAKQFMQNFQVADLDKLLAQLKAENITIVGEPQSYEYGKFAWILDLEGNKIELWEPVDRTFL